MLSNVSPTVSFQWVALAASLSLTIPEMDKVELKASRSPHPSAHHSPLNTVATPPVMPSHQSSESPLAAPLDYSVALLPSADCYGC